MKRVVTAALLLIAVLLGCAPGTVRSGVGVATSVVETAQADPARFTRDALGATVINGGSDAMTGDPSRAGDRIVAVLVGTNDLKLSPDAGQCLPGERAGYWRCFFPALGPGESWRLHIERGSLLSGHLEFYRNSRAALLLIRNLR